jgi:hypothetical protein
VTNQTGGVRCPAGHRHAIRGPLPSASPDGLCDAGRFHSIPPGSQREDRDIEMCRIGAPGVAWHDRCRRYEDAVGPVIATRTVNMSHPTTSGVNGSHSGSETDVELELRELPP